MNEEKPEGYDHYKLTVDLMQEKKELQMLLQRANGDIIRADRENERLKYWLKELLFFYENNSGPEYHQFSIRQIKELIADLPTEEPQLPQSESEP